MKKTKLLLFAIISVVSVSSTVHAQNTSIFYQNRQARSESQAVRQALINTLLPVAVGYGTVELFKNNTVQTLGASLAVYGLVVGPSTGNFYANDYLRGGFGALARFGAALLLKDHTSELFGSEFARSLNVDNKDTSFRDTNFIIGSSLLVGTAILNVVTAPISAREHNREMGYAMQIEELRGTGQTFPLFTAKVRF